MILNDDSKSIKITVQLTLRCKAEVLIKEHTLHLTNVNLSAFNQREKL